MVGNTLVADCTYLLKNEIIAKYTHIGIMTDEIMRGMMTKAEGVTMTWF